MQETLPFPDALQRIRIRISFLFLQRGIKVHLSKRISLLYGSVYTWLENRKNAGNFSGIHIGDYFHTNITAGTVAGYNIAAQNFKCRIVGINTYKSCADTNIGNMFYIMSDEVIDTPIKWNPTDNNNGTAAQNKPWLASAMYAIDRKSVV